MNKGGLMLRKREAVILEEGLKKISFHGAAIDGLCSVLKVIDIIKMSTRCSELHEEHKQLTSNSTAWSIRQAINALTYGLALEVERITELVEKGRIPGE